MSCLKYPTGAKQECKNSKRYLLNVPAVLLKEPLTRYFKTSAAVSAGCTLLIFAQTRGQSRAANTTDAGKFGPCSSHGHSFQLP